MGSKPDGAERRLARGAVAALLLAAAASTPGLAGDGAPVAPSPPPGHGTSIAILPFENLGDAAAPVAEIRETLRRKLADRGIVLLDDESLQKFMRQHRMRYIGGLARDMGRALSTETGAVAALVTSIDLYAEKDPPKLALTCRLVSAGEETHVLWMESAGLAGDERPGFLGLGRIEDPLVVRGRVTDRIAEALARHLSGAQARRDIAPLQPREPRRFRPRSAYRSPVAPAAGSGPVRVAVLPFSDESATRHAGEILSLQILASLVRAGGVEVVEPGVVREVLLNARLIQEEGPSIPQADLLRSLLQVDVVLFGDVTEYTETGAGAAEPEIDFSVRAIDTARRQVVWSSVSHARGDDGIFFFGLGRVPTAHALATEMARGLVGELLPALERTS
jgi:TolB-like protein